MLIEEEVILKILLTNDDGIFAAGIRDLARALINVGDVFVVAPDRQRSASGHSITMHQPLRAKEVDFYDLKVKAWAVSGTPSDCVKLAIEALMLEKPDMIFSGINSGANLGTDVLYSGTVSAAIEGAIHGFSSVAVSLASHKDMDYSLAADFSKKLAQLIYDKNLPKDTLLNINVPDHNHGKVEGVHITTLGVRKYKNSFIERIDPRGESYYWLGGEILDEDNPEGTDIYSIKNNFISVTPIHFDLTSFDSLKILNHWNIQL